MRRVILVSLCLAGMALAFPAAAQGAAPPQSLIDYRGFERLTSEVAVYRLRHLVSLEEFNAMAGEGDTLILDARSPAAFAAGHIRGAVNLTFTDFTAGFLAKAIGDPDRRILIYCNNNFSNDVEPVRTKALKLALNIQTFINLYGYGYRNVYELRDTVDLHDPRVGWVAAGT